MWCRLDFLCLDIPTVEIERMNMFYFWVSIFVLVLPLTAIAIVLWYVSKNKQWLLTPTQPVENCKPHVNHTPHSKNAFPPTKYYVHSGELNWVGITQNPSFAALEAVRSSDAVLDGCTICVDDRGHRSHDAHWTFETDEIVRQIANET